MQSHYKAVVATPYPSPFLPVWGPQRDRWWGPGQMWLLTTSRKAVPGAIQGPAAHTELRGGEDLGCEVSEIRSLAHPHGSLPSRGAHSTPAELVSASPSGSRHGQEGPGVPAVSSHRPQLPICPHSESLFLWLCARPPSLCESHQTPKALAPSPGPAGGAVRQSTPASQSDAHRGCVYCKHLRINLI